eukprot:TRINITY_DN56946_c0_g2_i1.p1 TRINITY_DN56946_c0_g2~~TRINITY_DN56946_c0_g2_i1.p1  ORF type:complete len:835 (-),score=9.45 TRINITY_DN56946_c0_g2_i1:203-2707(-)
MSKNLPPHLRCSGNNTDIRKSSETWVTTLCNQQNRKHPSIKKLIATSPTPPMLRGRSWAFLSGSEQLRAKYPAPKDERSKFDEMVFRGINTDVEFTMDADIAATFPNMDLFKPGTVGLRSLKRVLHAYAAFDSEQPQAPAHVAAVLLCYMPEEDAFWTLISLMGEYGLRHFSSPLPSPGGQGRDRSASELTADSSPTSSRHSSLAHTSHKAQLLTTLETLLKKECPKVVDRAHSKGLDVRGTFGPMLHLLFSNTLEFRYFARIWDCFFVHGWDFLLNFISQSLKQEQSTLVKLDDALFLTSFSKLGTHVINDKNIETLVKKALTAPPTGVSLPPWDPANHIEVPHDDYPPPLGVCIREANNPIKLRGEPSTAIVFVDVDSDGLLGLEGSKCGDMLMSINNTLVFTIEDVCKAMRNVKALDTVMFYCRPHASGIDPADDHVWRTRLMRERLKDLKTNSPRSPNKTRSTSVMNGSPPSSGGDGGIASSVSPKSKMKIDEEDKAGGGGVQPHLMSLDNTTHIRKVAEAWYKVLDSNKANKDSAEVRKLVRQGTPSMLRGKVWLFLSGAREMMKAHPEGYYKATLRKRVDAEYMVIIEKDLHRTYPNHPYFKKGSEGLVWLKRVLYAYTAFDDQVRYVQGMSFLCGTLLSYMTEEEAFWCLVAMMSEFGFHNVLIEGFPLVMELLKRLETLIQKMTPRLYQHLTDSGVQMPLFTGWFCTLFANELEFQFFTRIWDCFFLYGWKFILCFIMVVFKAEEEKLLQMDECHFIAAIGSMRQLVQGKNPDDLILKAVDMKMSMTGGEKWDYRTRRRGQTLYDKPPEPTSPITGDSTTTTTTTQ